jgi:hypothetical protein
MPAGSYACYTHNDSVRCGNRSIAVFVTLVKSTIENRFACSIDRNYILAVSKSVIINIVCSAVAQSRDLTFTLRVQM